MAISDHTSPQVAVVGCGYWGQNHVRNYHELGALQVVCDATLEGQTRARSLAPGSEIVESFEAVLASKVAGVILATPAPTHFDLARQALEAGKDVLVEKPLALKTAEGQALVDLARRHGRILMVGHILEYHPAFQKLVEVFRAGRLGELRYVYSNRLSLGKVRQQENVLWSLAPHDVCAVLRLTGTRPQTLVAYEGIYIQKDIADVATMQMTFPNNVRAHIFVSWMHPLKEQRLMVIGSKASAVFDGVAGEIWLYPAEIRCDDGIPQILKGPPEKLDFIQAEPLKNECQAFLNAIRTRKDPVADGRSGLLTLEVLEQAERSMQNCSTVFLQ